MTDFDTLKVALAEDRARLEAQEWALVLVEDFLRKLGSHGFAPRLTTPGGLVTITFDFDDFSAAPAAPGPEEAAEEPHPDPAPEPEAPEEPDPAPEPAPRTGPWTDDEVEEATRILRGGGTNSEVAQALNRRAPNVVWRCNKIREQLVATKPDPAADGSPSPVPAPAAPVRERADPPPGGLARGDGKVARAQQVQAVKVETHLTMERQLQAQLNALGHVEPWTPEADLQLVEGLMRGDGIGMTAGRIGIHRDLCAERWKALCPEVTIERQKLLVAELKRRIDARAA